MVAKMRFEKIAGANYFGRQLFRPQGTMRAVSGRLEDMLYVGFPGRRTNLPSLVNGQNRLAKKRTKKPKTPDTKKQQTKITIQKNT